MCPAVWHTLSAAGDDAMQNWQSYVIRLIHPLDHTGNYLAGAPHRPRNSWQKSDTIAAILCPACLQEFAKYVRCPQNCLPLRHRLEIFTAMHGKKTKNVTFQTPFKVLSSKHAFMWG